MDVAGTCRFEDLTSHGWNDISIRRVDARANTSGHQPWLVSSHNDVMGPPAMAVEAITETREVQQPWLGIITSVSAAFASHGWDQGNDLRHSHQPWLGNITQTSKRVATSTLAVTSHGWWRHSIIAMTPTAMAVIDPRAC